MNEWFVLRLSPEALARGELVGWVEHVRSGTSAAITADPPLVVVLQRLATTEDAPPRP